MNDLRATWQLVVEAAEQLTARGRATFKLSELVTEVQHADPARGRTTIQPVVQGMTANAGMGPASPCGKVLVRVEHGYYKLRGATETAPIVSHTPRPCVVGRRAN